MERGRRPTLVTCGALRLPATPLSERLERIFREMRGLIVRFAPQVLSIEQVFHGRNFQSVLKVGEARGVAVLAAQMSGLQIEEYAPALVKKAATGNGNADKSQVQKMMSRIFGSKEALGPLDATDALAVAFCHAGRLWKVPRRGRTSEGMLCPTARSVGLHPKDSAGKDGRRKSLLEALLKRGRARVSLGASFRKKSARAGSG